MSAGGREGTSPTATRSSRGCYRCAGFHDAANRYLAASNGRAWVNAQHASIAGFHLWLVYCVGHFFSLLEVVPIIVFFVVLFVAVLFLPACVYFGGINLGQSSP